MLNKGLPHPVLGNNNKVEFYRIRLNCQKKTPIFFAKHKKKAPTRRRGVRQNCGGIRLPPEGNNKP